MRMTLGSSLTAVNARENEIQRADQLAQLDAAKVYLQSNTLCKQALKSDGQDFIFLQCQSRIAHSIDPHSRAPGGCDFPGG